jgi:hypothetical protein
MDQQSSPVSDPFGDRDNGIIRHGKEVKACTCHDPLRVEHRFGTKINGQLVHRGRGPAMDLADCQSRTFKCQAQVGGHIPGTDKDYVADALQWNGFDG